MTESKPFFEFSLNDFGRSAEMHVKVKKFKRLKELRLLQKVVQKADMSLVSSCLKCVRMGRDDRYVNSNHFTSDMVSSSERFLVLT